VNDRRPNNHSIPTADAWDRIAKLLFPDEPVRAPTQHDSSLIDRFHFPGDMNRYRGFGGGCKTFGPPELILQVDRAYVRLSMVLRVNQWFEEKGFDTDQPTLPKHQFEAAVKAEFGQLPSEPAAVSKISQPMIVDHVKNYFDNTNHPTIDDCVSKWPHGSSARDLVRQRYRAEAKSRKILVKRGPRQNSAK
jgi:hypothetical protein